MQSKTCSKCKQTKPLSGFGPEARSADRRRYSCLACDRARRQAYHQRHKERRNAEARARRLANPEADRRYGRNYREKFVWRMMLQHAKKRAAKLGLEYELDDHIEEIKARLAPMTCEMTGVALAPGAGCGGQGKRYYNTPSLDRIDPTKGYLYSNIRIVCWAMNAALGTWGEARLKELMLAWMNKG